MKETTPRWALTRVIVGNVHDAVVLLNDIAWHDSVLYDLVLVRRNSADEVVMNLRLLTDWEAQLSCDVRLTFGRCFGVRADMTWGVECLSDGEMVYDATAYDRHVELERVAEKWKTSGLVVGEIGLFELDMASTSSSVRVIFREVRLEPVSGIGPHSAPPPLLPGAEMPD